MHTAPVWNPTNVVKDTIDMTLYVSVAGAPSSRRMDAYVCTASLPSYSHVAPHYIEAGSNGRLPDIDGVRIGNGYKLLLVDGSAYAGLYVVDDQGSDIAPWRLIRSFQLDESSEIGNDIYVAVPRGDNNFGVWHCTTASGTIDSTPLAFEQLAENFLPNFLLTIDYHAIELHYEYVSSFKRSEPLFIRDEYIIDPAGYIIVDEETGEKIRLKIENIEARYAVNTVNTDGTVSTATGSLTRWGKDAWKDRAMFVGTVGQFDQVPAGAYWHVTETATIKIVGIPAHVSGTA